jgi:hypothetical protein
MAEPGPDRPGEFSNQLEEWLAGDGTKTLGDLADVFAEKSFAVLILVLMFMPALPLPTGGVSDLFTAIAVVVAAELVLGRRTLWLPRRWLERELRPSLREKALPFVARRIRWFERFSRPRAAWLFQRRAPLRLLGLVVIVFAVATVVAPPFSGLDTLPAMGGVILALSIILEDVVVLAIGTALGAVGIALELALGAAAVELVQRVV